MSPSGTLIPVFYANKVRAIIKFPPDESPININFLNYKSKFIKYYRIA